tara:strand:+ start:2357 stop:2593 length:237 start_codon:yes stop_codon:yes gene_type:complete
MAKTHPKTLDDLLLESGESYDALADRMGTSRFTLYRLRSGLAAKPRRKTLLAIASALSCTVEEVRAACQASYDASWAD